MGNKKNRAKKNTKPNNWRNIIKMRKPKKKNSESGLSIQDSNCQQTEEHYIHDNLNLIAEIHENYNEINETETQVQVGDVPNSFEHNGMIEADESFNLDDIHEDLHVTQNGPNTDFDGIKGLFTDKVNNIEGVNEMQDDTSSYNFNFDDFIEVDYNENDEYNEVEAINTMQDDTSSYNFNFDDFVEVDYNENDEYNEVDAINTIEIEDIYDSTPSHNVDSRSEGFHILNEIEIGGTIHLQPVHEHIHESQYDNEQQVLNENESVSAHEYSQNEGGSYDASGNENEELMEQFESLDDANIQCSDNIKLSGQRIVDIGFFIFQMEHLNRHSEDCDSRRVFQQETKMGLRSIFHFECSNCGCRETVQSSSKHAGTMNVNKAATLGVTSIGSGFYHMQELCAHLSIPCMSSSTFDTENKELQGEWDQLAKYHAKEALYEEIKLAIARGDVDSAGNALIRVVCDGSWGKRSYGKGFSSLSGCAAIIGFCTKKVLYFDTKNKYCNICTKSYAKFCPPNDHICNISYVGPSSGMETEIIVEGFEACELLGARFHKIISDGDSSAFKEISERCIYQNPDLVVEKFECINHLFKNFRKKFCDLCENTKFDLKCRKMINPCTGDDVCMGIRMAAKHWRESNVSTIQKLENLEKDCLNAPYHYFGNHDNCSEYFCKKTTTAQSNTTIDLLKSGGVFYEILNYCNVYFFNNVKSLIEDLNNNSAEELNNVIAKYLGGKRINYSLAGSYTGRVSAAVVNYNTKGHAGSEFHKSFGIIPNADCLKMENSRINHYAKNEAARQLKPRKRATKDKNTKGYGDGQKADICDRALEVAIELELDKLRMNQTNRNNILTNTFGQKLNLEWLIVRKKMINCYYFGQIINAQSPKSYQKILEEMLYAKIEFGNTAEVRHQRIYEQQALKVFSLIYKDYELQKTGIFIDKEFCFLGASPIRLYGPDSIVNVTCPVKGFGKTFDEAMSAKKKVLPLKFKDGELWVNVKSKKYIEIQGQLHITERKVAYLVVWLGKEFTIKRVTVDHSFWKNQMVKKLNFFFNGAMIKEIANSRKARKMELRKYDSQTKTFI